MKKNPTQQDVDEGVAALDQLRERIIPKSFRTNREVFDKITADHPETTHFDHVLTWDEKTGRLSLAVYGVGGPDNPHGPFNDSHPCPPCCPDCP